MLLTCRSSGWFWGSSGLKTLLKPNSHDCSLSLILESGWLHTSPSMSGFRDKQRTLVNTVRGPGDSGSSPSKSKSKYMTQQPNWSSYAGPPIHRSHVYLPFPFSGNPVTSQYLDTLLSYWLGLSLVPLFCPIPSFAALARSTGPWVFK
jgi:hypothetical protein